MSKKTKVATILWSIFIGPWLAIASAIFGVASCVTVIGIPFGVKDFKAIKFMFSPNKRVITHFKKHPVANVFYLIFGGIELYFICCCFFIFSLFFRNGVTKYFETLRFILSPFGAEIIDLDVYSNEKEDFANYSLLIRRIVANPTVLLKMPDNTEKPVGQYLTENYSSYAKAEDEYNKQQTSRGKKFFLFSLIPAVIILIVSLISGNNFIENYLPNFAQWIQSNPMYPVVVLIVALIIVLTFELSVMFFVYNIIINKINGPLLKYAVIYWLPLKAYYPGGSPMAEVGVFHQIVTKEKTINAQGKEVVITKVKRIIDAVLEKIYETHPEYKPKVNVQPTM